MKKIVQDIIHYPDDCEIGVLMCFNLMYDQAEKVRIPHTPASPPAWCTDFNRQCDYCGVCGDEAKKDRPVSEGSLHCSLAIVSGIAFAYPDLSTSTKLKIGIEEAFTAVVDDYDNYLSYLCQFVGYSHKECSPEKPKDTVFSEIKQCIDQEKILMMQSSSDSRWQVIYGYNEEDQSIFIYKWDNTVVVCQPVEEEKSKMTDWYENFSRLIYLTEKNNQKPFTHQEVFSRLYRLLKIGHDNKYYENSIRYVLDDSHYETVSHKELIQEHKKLHSLCFGIVIHCCNAAWGLDRFLELHQTNWAEKFAKEYASISTLCGIHHDLGHITAGAILENRNQNFTSQYEIVEKLRSRTN